MRCFRHVIDWGEEGWLSNVITAHAYVRVHSHSMRNLLRRGESWAVRRVSSCIKKKIALGKQMVSDPRVIRPSAYLIQMIYVQLFCTLSSGLLLFSALLSSMLIIPLVATYQFVVDFCKICILEILIFLQA